MGLNLSKSFKNNPLNYIRIKSKFNSKYLKAFKRISDLSLIDLNMYLSMHEDCRNENLHPVAHYLFYGRYDEDKSYINCLFDLDYYFNTYLKDNSKDPLIDYVLDGFFKNNLVNSKYGDFVNSLKEPMYVQYLKNSNYITEQSSLASYLLFDNPLESEEIKIAVFMNDPFENLAPCPYIRIHSPLKALSDEGGYKFFIYGADSYNLIDISQMLKSKLFDIVIVQRILPFLDILQDKCLKQGIKLIYETDDDLLGVEENSPSFEYVDMVRPELTDFINASDVVTVSTPYLASKFSNKNVEVIKNYYVEEVFNIKKSTNNNTKLKLGYFGTLTHSKDLILIKDMILELKKSYDFDFEIIGGFNEDDEVTGDWYSSIKLPENNMNFAHFMGWLENNTNWDIGIVPLEDSEFNRGKSELKYIELSVLGIPAVFSDMVVYNSVIKDGVTGFLASDNEEWIQKTKNLISDSKLREKMHQNALNDVLINYNKKNRVHQWKKVIDSLVIHF